MVNRALISVYNKHGLLDFARGLHELGVEIISTGGTAKVLREANIPVIDISKVTNFPEIMDGRVKTLHPKIAAGILGKRDKHEKEAREQQISWIDLVICNLYPFAETIAKPNIDLETALENIDIGGPTMLRAAAKNFSWVGVIVDTNDYTKVLLELQENKKQLSPKTLKQLATKAFAHVAQYDSLIAEYLNDELFPQQLTQSFNKISELRYGENPHQKGCFYQSFGKHDGLLTAKQHQGKQLSFNNIVDADAALGCLKEFSEPACVIVKHTNPCGVAEHKNINHAFLNAWHADSTSAFGGIVVLNRTCSEEIASHIANVFVEVLVAPDYTEEALRILQKKLNLRVLQIKSSSEPQQKCKFKYVDGGMLLQTTDDKKITANDLKVVTKIKPSQQQITDLLFAWKVVKHVKSNAVVIVNDKTTLGVGCGQVSRIDSVRIAIQKAGNFLHSAVLASDAFFPFRDSIDLIANTRINAIIQPGGSIRDAEVIAACDGHNIAMVFTGIRCFNH
jgi:phosphoribosylaminoimidazolecarboxamide formyltransferase/IMP cyclohydrolase